jgi:hypothetical protein
MKYRIQQLTSQAGALTIVAQPVTDRGMVARGCEDFTVAPGLLCGVLRSAMQAGQTWEIEADRQGKVTRASRDGIAIGGAK